MHNSLVRHECININPYKTFHILTLYLGVLLFFQICHATNHIRLIDKKPHWYLGISNPLQYILIKLSEQVFLILLMCNSI